MTLASPRRICNWGRPISHVLIHVNVVDVFVSRKHQTYENATLAASNIPPSFKESQPQSQLQQQHSVGGAGGGVKIKHVAHKPTVNDSAESALPATASW